MGWLVCEAFIQMQRLQWISRGWRLVRVGLLPCLGPGAGAGTESLMHWKHLLLQQQAALLQAVGGFAVLAEHRATTSALQTEEQEFGASQGCGMCSVACQVCPSAIAPYPARGATGWGSSFPAECWQDSASPSLGTHQNPPGTVAFRVCSALSNLVLWLLLEIFSKLIDARSWKLRD